MLSRKDNVNKKASRMGMLHTYLNFKKNPFFFKIKTLNALLCILINTTCQPRHNVSLNTSVFTMFSTCFDSTQSSSRGAILSLKIYTNIT